MQDHTSTNTKRYQCRHIFTDGHRCGTPCLRNEGAHEEFCYYHHTTRRPVADLRTRRSRQSAFDLALPEDRSAIQSAIGEVLRRIASNDLDPRRAGLLLYGLQIASLNLPRQPQSTAPAAHQTQEFVTEVVTHPTLGILAPTAEISEPTKRPSVASILLSELLKGRTTEPAPAPEPTSLPCLQATAELTPQPLRSLCAGS